MERQLRQLSFSFNNRGEANAGQHCAHDTLTPGRAGQPLAPTPPPCFKPAQQGPFRAPSWLLFATSEPETMLLPLPGKLFLPLLASFFPSVGNSSEKGLSRPHKLNRPPAPPPHPHHPPCFPLDFFGSLPLPEMIIYEFIKMFITGASLVAQWLRICLPMQGTRVRALVWEDSHMPRSD